MQRRLASEKHIKEFHARRRKAYERRKVEQGDEAARNRESTAPQNSGLTREQTNEALDSLPESEHKIPGKLIPKLPS